MMKKAYSLEAIDNAVRFNEPVGPDHEFFTDFSEVRGDFEDRVIYRALNVDPRDFTFDSATNALNKTLLFLAGMRGSGKTSQLAKYVAQLNHPEGFFCVVCNVDEELDMNHVEYMDILIFQLEKLAQRAQAAGLKPDKKALDAFQEWFQERIREINKRIQGEAGIELGLTSETPGFLANLLKIFGSMKAGISGSVERATTIRTTLKNNFTEFALKANEFIEELNREIRKKKQGREILFIIDGLEKTMSVDTRRKIILEESNRLRQIKANTLFTLPIELMKYRQQIKMFSAVVTFPFVKLFEANGDKIEAAFVKFREFVLKRIDFSLFDDEDTLQKAIYFGGGSPRELLRILEYAGWHADENLGKIDSAAMDKAIRKLAAETAQYLEEKHLLKLVEIHKNNQRGQQTAFDDTVQYLLENLVLLEYNDGSYKRINPVVEEAPIYRQYLPPRPTVS